MKELVFIAAVVLYMQPDPLMAEHSTSMTMYECIECHPRAKPTHRRQQPQTMTDPLPLDAEGRMTCLTCHTIKSGECVLRQDRDTLCGICHSKTHGMACIGIAHLGDSMELHTAPESYCLGCHDGAVAVQRGLEQDHRLGVQYASSSTRKMKAVMDKRIVFVDGRISCVTCHDPYRNQDMRLVKSNQGSGLCLTCHDK